MSEETTVVDQTKNDPALAEETNNQQNAQVEGQGQPQAEGEKQEEKSPYELEVEKFKTQLQQKNAALHEERERRRQAEVLLKKSEESNVEASSEADEEKEKLEQRLSEILTRQEQLERALNRKAIDDEITRQTSDLKEQEAIKLHLEHSVKTTGNIRQDVENARLLANRHVLYEQGKKAGLEAKKEEVLSSLTLAGTSAAKKGVSSSKDPTAVDILRRLDPTGKAEKFL